ncbi:MAG: hypothetical protein ACRDIY_22410, partial [Chloroflexota bacterium]
MSLPLFPPIRGVVARVDPLARARRIAPGLRAGAVALTLWAVATGPAFAAPLITPAAGPAAPPAGVVTSVPVPAAPLPGPSSAGSAATCPSFAIDANGNTVRTLGACPPPAPPAP